MVFVGKSPSFVNKAMISIVGSLRMCPWNGPDVSEDSAYGVDC